MAFSAQNHFLDTVYGSAGDAGYWQRAVEAFSSCIDGGVGQISAHGPRWGDVRIFAVPAAVPQAMIEDYIQLYADGDPRIAGAADRSGRMVACHELVDTGAFERTALVTEFLDRKELNLRWCCGHVETLDSDTTMLVSLMRERKRGPFEPQDVVAIERLSRHLHRAARLHADLARTELALARLEATLDQLSDAIFVCERDGRVRHMNQAAVRLAERGDAVLVAAGLLRAVQSDAARQLAGAMMDAASLSPDCPNGRTDVVLHRPADASPVIARLHPLPRHLGMDVRTARGEVVIVVRDPAASSLSDAGALRALGLSAREIHLTQALIDGKSLAEHAAERKVSIETVRSQMKSALSKAGVSRQAELVALAMRYVR